jgi:hypothetical protein
LTAYSESVSEFLLAYGPEGEWGQVFRIARGYLRTELYQDQKNPLRFVTIDHWDSKASWADFRAEFASEFEALDARCECFTVTENPLGSFSGIEHEIA